MAEKISVKQFSAGSCFSYVLYSGNDAIIVDPHISLLDAYASFVAKNQLFVRGIIDTHTHADHFSLAAVLKKQFNAPVYMGEKAISDVADKRLKDGDEISLGGKKIRIIYTPGHTDDAISIYTGDAVLTGDVLLIGSVGRTDFQNGSPESMFDSLQKLKSLPEETIIFPGHDYHEKHSSVLRNEKTANVFLKEPDKNAFTAAMRAKTLAKPFNMDNIIRVNRTGQAVSLAMMAPRDAAEMAQKDANVKFLDVRSALEYSQVHIDKALNIPIDALGARINELSQSGNTFIVLCRTGNRSPMAADMLIQAGIHGVKVMNGGMTQWEKERLPVIKGVGGVSLERQVRIAAGSITLVGIVLSMLVHWAFILISIFICCGLIYAGLTDNCMMGMLLMKLPYNKKLYKTKLGGGTCAMG